MKQVFTRSYKKGHNSFKDLWYSTHLLIREDFSFTSCRYSYFISNNLYAFY